MNEMVPPRISRKRAAVIVAVALALTGAAIGALWAWLAPSIHGVVALTKDGDRVRAHLGNEADHFFVAAFLMVGMLCTVAVIAAVLVWQWRAHRSPTMVAGLALGAAAAAGAAAGVGAALVHWRYGSDRRRRRADLTRASRALRHRGTARVLRALTAGSRHHDSVSRRHRRTGLFTHGSLDRARRSGRVAAGGRTCDPAARHRGRRSVLAVRSGPAAGCPAGSRPAGSAGAVWAAAVAAVARRAGGWS